MSLRETPETRPATGPTPVLEVTDLCLDLHTGSISVPVVRDVSLRIRPGEVLGVVGESGSGKSLTALSIMGMLPRAVRVRSGTVSFQGRDLLPMSDRELARLRGDRIGMVFQDPLAFLNPLMTVGQQIREVLTLHGASRSAAAARTVDLLGMVGVRDASTRVDDYPHQFSGGMRQRVIIAIAIANNPSLLIADEPTTALDVTVQAEILRLLLSLRDELDMAVMLITHDIGVVEETCDDALVLYAGEIAEHGPVDEVLGRPRHPYTRELIAATPRLDNFTGGRLVSVAGQPPDVMKRPTGCAFHPRCPLAVDRCLSEDPPLVDRGTNRRHEVACWLSSEPLPVRLVTPVQQADPSPDDDAVLLEVDDVVIGYRERGWWRSRAQAPVVDGVSLRAHAGRSLGLVGESGSGKSTLAKAIMGMLPVQSGSITIDGVDWAGAGPERRSRLRRTAQMIFQDPYQSLNPRQTVGDVVSEPLVVHGLVRSGAREARVHELFDLVGLPKSLMGRYPYQLSGGQRQRVGIARALAMEPKLLVADEPVSSLDVSVQAQIINLLGDLRDELGLGLVVIAHDLSVVRYLCEDVAVMSKGQIVEHGPAERVLTDPEHTYTAALLQAAPRPRHTVPASSTPLEGT